MDFLRVAGKVGVKGEVLGAGCGKGAGADVEFEWVGGWGERLHGLDSLKEMLYKLSKL